jgi:hypothetical protein
MLTSAEPNQRSRLAEEHAMSLSLNSRFCLSKIPEPSLSSRRQGCAAFCGDALLNMKQEEARMQPQTQAEMKDGEIKSPI